MFGGRDRKADQKVPEVVGVQKKFDVAGRADIDWPMTGGGFGSIVKAALASAL
jgi:hypothetical protein